MNEQTAPITIHLADEPATIQFGEDLALALSIGDCVALEGDLGAGKSTTARALLRAMADDPELEVPSPTFTLVQSYHLRLPVAHFDLYRLSDESELDELGFHDALSEGICLVEWPSKAARSLPKETISISFAFPSSGGRTVTVVAPEPKLARIRRVLTIRSFLVDNELATAKRRHLTGDASSRAYEVIYPGDGAERLVLMDAPKRPNGPPIRDGKPYSQLVHLAEDLLPFIAIDQLLRGWGFAAPAIHAADLDQGILLLEDLGSDGVIDAERKPIAERYRESVLCLAAIHQAPLETRIALPGGQMHVIPDFDRAAMKFETELLLDWYIPHRRGGGAATAEERADYLEIWNGLIDHLADCERSIVLRDFHSPNIIWRADKIGTDRVGLIDFQDAMIGPAAYDVASLVQDARVTVDRALMDNLLSDYVEARSADPAFDVASFHKAFAIMAAQRSCKLLGLWVRLKDRDGKPGYMAHMPRTIRHLGIAFEHPVLAPLRAWYARVGINPSESPT
ncbi:tRNA (adenosine(37)-N6)-threonylcarbamoyltransferase complex ATPase subunit type 1 TsaE [Peteryoungia ipomoeae]|uniref:tRNA threonylcarbamoyladenosine biosynthesis protein TsaE n=1 Tax=Peteryoungia ipomoeae TaxID=1210932 RepID=A0A4S8NWW6_9HYPH|nr:tRNA (adenosine(37)-N6)-threonylcarbamoyltransferase complex ATPase subunit type 1 TsaE [Peteryoungia ipomoeae]THV22133.1 tRNA (adenosine(37)-N6)-threonylcarbamoyltransferase complex ATPase subunit type 1 TsaE [Peteryoungia ipomoeae]